MTDGTPIPLLSRPGVKRDGTTFDGDYYVDAKWCRWHEGRARKIGGFRQIYGALDDIVRAIDSHPHDNSLYIHLAGATKLTRAIFDVNTYNIAGVADRTPVGFVSNSNYLWQIDQMYDAGSSFTNGPMYVLAHVAPNALDIASDTEGIVYYGEAHASDKFVSISGSNVSGGLVCLYPFLLIFGSDGYVRQSVANQPTNFTGVGSNQARVTGTKIVKGMVTRGGAGNSPSGLLWSLDSLIRVSFVGGSAIFAYDNMSNQNGILAANSVVEHDGVYYWVGLGRFMMFNGVVRELVNSMNSNFFFDNLNWPYRNKTFAFKVARFGEIWWCFPKTPSTEPNWAIIHNVKENTWYDTELPGSGRSAGENPSSFRFPLLSGVDVESSVYKLWQHELGWDEVAGSPTQSRAVRSYFETNEFSALTAGQNRALSGGTIEPDFVQSGDMTVTVIGRNSQRVQTATESTPQRFVAAPTTPADYYVNFKNEYRLTRFRFESNVAGGSYQCGKPLWRGQPSGGRST